MAIDLAYSSPPYEFENMLPLDVLAAVATETLRNEIHSNDTSECKNYVGYKKQVKKSVTNVMTFEDIKSMPVKSLIDKFSEMTSDELTKKYFYKCLLLPQKCSMMFKSFGNEKKACDKMKSHLLSHVQQLTLEHESNNGLCNVFFIPKSPNSNSKHAEKVSKKASKKHHITFSHVLSRSGSIKTSKKSKSSAFCVKKVKKKFHNMNKKRASEKVKNVMKYFKASKSKMFSPVYEENEGDADYMNGGDFVSDLEDDFFDESEEIHDESEEIQDESDTCERYSSYSEHLQYAFLTDTIVKEEIGELPCSSDQVPESVDEGSSSEQLNLSFNLSTCSVNSCYNFLQDHNYANYGETKILPPEYKSSPRKSIVSGPRKQTILPQLIIRTPPFPYVYTPLLPEIAEIEEVNYDGKSTRINDCTNCVHCMLNEKKIKKEIPEVQNNEFESDHEEKFAPTIFYKMNGASSSVLECVENIVNSKYSNACVPKSEISASDNDENLENLQKVEKELALKYIAKLHGKGKKKIPDSLMCQICPDKHFTAQATLIHHYRSHAGIKPYICKICSAKFTRQHSLNYHMLIHQNRSRFTCEVCSRTFRHPSHYKEHLRRHTGETPYHCTDCNLHFKTRNTFKRHLKTRHGKLLTANGIEDLIVE